ncbi:hypothetical protein Q5O89_02260 [Peribacillus frigoritolerans]|nr:hypothetical protein [Peribacillus frigoritolerans]
MATKQQTQKFKKELLQEKMSYVIEFKMMNNPFWIKARRNP